jgi:DNA-binding NtrC family response regulator
MTTHRQRHPLIAAYANNTGKLYDLLLATPPPRGPLIDAMILMWKARLSQIPFAEALAAAEDASGTECDGDLYVLFLRLWIDVAFKADRRDECLAVLRRAQSLISDASCPEVRASLLLREGLLYGGMGNKAAREECQRRAIALLTPDSGRRRIFVTSHALFLAQMGRAADAQEDISWLHSQLDDVYGRVELQGIDFINHVELGRPREAELLLTEMRQDPHFEQFAAIIDMSTWITALEVMLRRWELKAAKEPLASLARRQRLEQHWAKSTDLLLRKQAGEALERARSLLKDDPDANVHVGFPYYVLVRAELSNGNGEAARRIVHMRRSRGFAHYLDDLFLARIELLAGNGEKAVRHFAVALAACEKYGAQGRLDLELRMACELTPTELMELTQRALTIGGKTDVLELTPERAPKEPRGLERLIGSGGAAAAVKEAILRYAAVEVPVLITGETGTGKELVAQAIHDCSPRAAGPFVAVNCGAITESLLESELFGHVRGAFTGAEREQPGIFRAAGTGTVLLDEIGETPARLQVALLRVLETGEVRSVGGSLTEKIGCRVLTATNASLERMIETGGFRKDLFYRLQRAEIALLPLRERKADILPLANHFLSRDRRDQRRPVISEALKNRLLVHPWPGNVRELRNVIERMRLLSSDKIEYGLADLEELLPASGGASPGTLSGSSPALDTPVSIEDRAGEAQENVEAMLRAGSSPLRRMERLRAMFHKHGKLTRAEVARILKVSPRTATRDLKLLCREGLIARVEPTKSPRTHYFALLPR